MEVRLQPEMEVRLQPEKEAQLAQIAAQRGTDPGELVQHVLSRYLEDDTHFVGAVNLGLAAAARGEFVEHEEVGKKLKEILLP
jgi:predicted transcriptional regulator